MEVRIPCVWQVWGIARAQVQDSSPESLAQAVTQLIREGGLPAQESYVEDSLEIDWDGIAGLNPGTLPSLEQVRKLVEGK
jgi:hypothetical protein